LTPAFEVLGSGPDLALVPGTFSDRRTWLKVVGGLASRFRCLLFDPRGLGETPDPGVEFGPDDLVDDLVAVLDAAGVERPHLMGHSLGAHVCLLLASRFPQRAAKVVAVAPTLHMDPYLLWTVDCWAALARSDVSDHELHRALVAQAFGRGAYERLVPAVVADMDRRPIARATVLRYVGCDRRQDLRPHLGRVDADVLVVAGDEDALVGLGQPRALASGLPQARLAIIEGCGHSPQVERPAELARLAAGFLSK
jgi:pimeloyl-ACP methyl ester carboxylesterase